METPAFQRNIAVTKLLDALVIGRYGRAECFKLLPDYLVRIWHRVEFSTFSREGRK